MGSEDRQTKIEPVKKSSYLHRFFCRATDTDTSNLSTIGQKTKESGTKFGDTGLCMQLGALSLVCLQLASFASFFFSVDQMCSSCSLHTFWFVEDYNIYFLLLYEPCIPYFFVIFFEEARKSSEQYLKKIGGWSWDGAS